MCLDVYLTRQNHSQPELENQHNKKDYYCNNNNIVVCPMHECLSVRNTILPGKS